MQSAAAIPLLSVEEYLVEEQRGAIRHEYIGGQAHAMAGTS